MGDFDTEWEAAEPTKSVAAAEGKGINSYSSPSTTLFLSPLIVQSFDTEIDSSSRQ